MREPITWTRLPSGEEEATVGPYYLLACANVFTDGAWWSVRYGVQKYASGEAMTLENAKTLAENATR